MESLIQEVCRQIVVCVPAARRLFHYGINQPLFEQFVRSEF